MLVWMEKLVVGEQPPEMPVDLVDVVCPFKIKNPGH